jgi:hypothetical protein
MPGGLAGRLTGGTGLTRFPGLRNVPALASVHVPGAVPRVNRSRDDDGYVRILGQ